VVGKRDEKDNQRVDKEVEVDRWQDDGGNASIPPAAVADCSAARRKGLRRPLSIYSCLSCDPMPRPASS
jgi:hypothetical protein